MILTISYIWNAICSQNLPKTAPMNAVKRFLMVDKIYMQLPVPLSALFKYVPQRKLVIRTSTPLAKSRLLVPQDVIDSLGDTLCNDLAKDFTRHRQKGNSLPVVTITERPFLWYLDYHSSARICQNFFLFLDLCKQGGQNGCRKLRSCFKQLGI